MEWFTDWLQGAIEKLPFLLVDRSHVRQCETCTSQGEIEESNDAKTDED